MCNAKIKDRSTGDVLSIKSASMVGVDQSDPKCWTAYFPRFREEAGCLVTCFIQQEVMQTFWPFWIQRKPTSLQLVLEVNIDEIFASHEPTLLIDDDRANIVAISSLEAHY